MKVFGIPPGRFPGIDADIESVGMHGLLRS
jgi:hypothetical protein